MRCVDYSLASFFGGTYRTDATSNQTPEVSTGMATLQPQALE